MVLVHPLDHGIHVFVVLHCIHVSEIVSKKNKALIGDVVVASFIEVFSEFFSSIFSIKGVGLSIVDPRFIIVKNVKVEA